MQYPNLIDTKEFGYDAMFRAMGTAGTDREEDVALRCQALTELYAGGISRQFAEDFGLSVTQWNNIEGSGKLSKEVAFRIVRVKPIVSLDWLWFGSDRGLTPSQADEFLAAFLRVSDKRTPKRAS